MHSREGARGARQTCHAFQEGESLVTDSMEQDPAFPSPAPGEGGSTPLSVEREVESADRSRLMFLHPHAALDMTQAPVSQ